MKLVADKSAYHLTGTRQLMAGMSFRSADQLFHCLAGNMQLVADKIADQLLYYLTGTMQHMASTTAHHLIFCLTGTTQLMSGNIADQLL